MRVCRAVLIAIFVVAGGPLHAQGVVPDSGRSLAATCANCHGTGGASAGVISSLAGRTRDEIIAKMHEFKSGTRAGTVMPQLARGYSDEQIELTAAWFAAQPPAR